MINRKLTLLMVVMLTIVTSVFGWGTKGHDIIAEIAYRHLTPKAKKEIHRILEGRSMVYYSSWMDYMRVLPEYKFTATWHYANVNEGESYASMEKEEKGDVYTAVTDIVDKLSKNPKMDDSTKQFYVKALVHLVGDMHCPMHTGRLTDLGGNKFKIKWFNSPTSLHTVWDSKLLESSRSWSYSEWVDNIDYMNPETTMAQYTKTSPLEWLNETVDLGKQAYLGVEEGGNYSYDYIRDNAPILHDQLLKAGYRLAYLLNNIFR